MVAAKPPGRSTSGVERFTREGGEGNLSSRVKIQRPHDMMVCCDQGDQP